MKLFEPRPLKRNHALALLALALLSAIAGIAFSHPAWKFATNALWIVIMVWHVLCLAADLYRTNKVRKRLEELQVRTRYEVDQAMLLMAQATAAEQWESGAVMTLDAYRAHAKRHLEEADKLLSLREAICEGLRKATKEQIG